MRLIAPWIVTLALALGGCIAGDAKGSAAQGNVNTLRMALEQYATDHQGAYPPTENWVQAIATKHYLPGNQLPPSPWGDQAHRQTASLTPADFRPGPGHVPSDRGFDGSTWGALLYAREGTHYTIRIVAREGEQAVLK